jgi:hypothetical protein
MLSRYFRSAESNDLEVTLLLAIAGSGLLIPYARLTESEHPSKDKNRFESAKNSINGVLTSKFLGSPLNPESNPGSWKIGSLVDVADSPDFWDWTRIKPISKDKTVNPLLKILRNALAHGNIFTMGSRNIESIVFLSKINAEDPAAGYNCLVVGPADFKDFISRWLRLLAEAKIPGDVFSEELSLV